MQAYPLFFRPLLKQTIWGGRRLGEQLGKPIGGESNYAESWELVDHGEDQSIVTNGPLAGQSLSDLVQHHPRWLLGGANPQTPPPPVPDRPGAFPLLLKYLDCNRVLSVQVHPDDQYGLTMEQPDLGKTEAWYIVAAQPESRIYAGLRPGVDRSTLAEAIENGTTESVLHSFQPNAGDIVFIPAGTVHALGAGLLVAEIQQSSNTTFRLFDWNRTDADGNPRPLHIEQSLAVTDYESGPVHAKRSDRSVPGLQTIVRCDKFEMQVLERGMATIGGDDKFHIITVPRGELTLEHLDSVISLTAGQSLLLPAAISRAEIGVADSSTALVIQLP